MHIAECTLPVVDTEWPLLNAIAECIIFEHIPSWCVAFDLVRRYQERDFRLML